MTRQETRWCVGFGVALAIVTTLPYVWAFHQEGSAWRFSGFLFGVGDGNSYIAKMLAGSYGAWLFRTPYTTVPQSGILAFEPYLLMGKLAAGMALHEQLVVLFHGARFAATPLAVLATYSFASRFTLDLNWRRWVTVLASIGGGLGWLLLVLGKTDAYGTLPLEFYSPETFGFLAFLGLPHLLLGRALLLAGLGWYLDASSKPRRAIWAGAALLLLGLFQPLAVASAWVVIAVYLLLQVLRSGPREVWSAGHVRAAGASILMSAPVVLYYGGLAAFDPFVRAWNAQNIILSPHPAYYLLAYGPMAAVGLFGVARSLPKGGALLPLGWLLALPALAYAPLNLQRRLPDGLWVAIVVLAATALERLPRPAARWIGTAVAVVTVPSCLILLAGCFASADDPRPPVFIPSEEAQAAEALASFSAPGVVVLASFETSNVLPAWSPVRVLIGHGPESVGLAGTLEDVQAFFDPTTPDAVRMSLLAERQIGLVFEGPDERKLGAWEPDQAPFLTSVFASGDYAIYSVSSLAASPPAARLEAQ